MTSTSLSNGVRYALIAAAIGLLSVTPSFAQKTWTRGAGTAVWTTAGNWSPSGAPTAGQTTTFTATSPRPGTVAIGSTNTANLGSMSITGGNYTFTSTGGSLTFAGATLTNNGTATIQSLGIVGGTSLTTAGTGTTTLGGLQEVGGSGSGTLSVGSKVRMPSANATNVAVSVTSGGELTLGSFNTDSTLTNTSGIIKGAADGNVYMAVSADAISLISGTAALAIGGDGSFDTMTSTNATTFGGNLDLNLAPLGVTQLTTGSTLDLFQFVSQVGNFNAVSLTGVDSSSPYAGLTFSSPVGGVWTSTTSATNGQYLVFDQNTGNLVVVPEPSTIVFAGIGVGMAGWTAWKKRRLAKVLAKN